MTVKKCIWHSFLIYGVSVGSAMLIYYFYERFDTAEWVFHAGILLWLTVLAAKTEKAERLRMLFIVSTMIWLWSAWALFSVLSLMEWALSLFNVYISGLIAYAISPPLHDRLKVGSEE